MTDISKLPLALYKANLELQITLGKLFQDRGTQWLQSGQQLTHEGAQDLHAELQALLGAEDWQELATRSTSSFQNHLQRRFSDNQALAQVAIEAQARFVQGIQDAVRTWQQQTAEVVAELAPTARPDNSAWSQLLKPWEQMLQAASQGATTAGKTASKKEGK